MITSDEIYRLEELYRRALANNDVARAKQIRSFLQHTKRQARGLRAVAREERLQAEALDSY